MIILPPPKYRKSGRSKPRRRIAAPATEILITGFARIHYDPDLETLFVEPTLNTSVSNPLVNFAAASPGKWLAIYQNKEFMAHTLTQISANRFEIQFELGGGSSSPDKLIYLNNPSDIEDASGRTLKAFVMELA